MMPLRSIGRLVAFLAAITAFNAPSATVAATTPAYPERPVRLVVGFPPGGGSDTVARIIAPKLTEALGRPWVVDNRGGAAGNFATEIVAKADPNGYTVLLVQGTSLTVNPTLYKLNFNVAKDLQPVILMAVAQYMFVASSSLKVSTLKEFVDLAKAQPEKLNYASAGSGGPHHLAAELFKMRAGINMVHVPYKGGGPAVLALLANEVQAMFGSLPSLLPQVRAGRIKALGVTGSVRSAAAPEIPTVAESGYPGFDVTSWFGLLVPARTPETIVKLLYETTSKTLEMPDVKEAIRREGLEVATKDPDRLSAYINAETALWANVVKKAGIRVD
jgi:tripartite-type tricarboxylate transporter receptor subunit TctC